MFNQFFNYLFMFCIPFMIMGCSTIFSAQEWSDNYALMDGVQSTSPQMVDGNLETVGEAAFTSDNTMYARNDKGDFVRNDSIVVVSLSEKKKIYRITLAVNNGSMPPFHILNSIFTSFGAEALINLPTTDDCNKL